MPRAEYVSKPLSSFYETGGFAAPLKGCRTPVLAKGISFTEHRWIAIRGTIIMRVYIIVASLALSVIGKASGRVVDTGADAQRSHGMAECLKFTGQLPSRASLPYIPLALKTLSYLPSI
jgi:hypothetical protein